MPSIRPSSDLRNNYNEISEFCHSQKEPVYITRNGKGDLAVMSIEAYEQLTSRYELYNQIDKGLEDINKGRVKPARDVFSQLVGRDD